MATEQELANAKEHLRTCERFARIDQCSQETLDAARAKVEKLQAQLDYEPMTSSELGLWARKAESGDYLVEYEDTGMTAEEDPGSRCGYDDQQLDQVGRWLRERGLKLTADDRGLVVEIIGD